jgi:hypothetical protein
MSNPHPLKKNQWKKGQSGNPDGKPPGTLDFKTKWFNFIKKIADQNELKPEDIDDQIFAVVLKEIRAGNFQFYKDTKDRIHGKASESMDLTSGGKPIVINVAKEIANQNGIPTE